MKAEGAARFSLRLAAAAVLTATVVLGASCGSGGGGSFGGGIGGSGLVVGPITGFGSIIVGDVEFETTAAIVTLNGDLADEGDLRLGMVVRVEGEIDADGVMGVADTVEFETVLEGPIDAVDLMSDAVDVLGDTVVIDGDTVLDGLTFDAGSVGTVVEVSGLVDADGTVRATRIAQRLVDNGFVLSGIVQDLDEVAETFRIRKITVDYSTAQIVDAPAGGLRDGLGARVSTSARPVADAVVADRVRFREVDLPDEAGKEVRLQGFVTSVPAADEFVLAGRVRVRVLRGTRFVNGDVDDLARNRAVTVNGRLTAAGAVLADRVVFRTVDAVDPQMP